MFFILFLYLCNLIIHLTTINEGIPTTDAALCVALQEIYRLAIVLNVLSAIFNVFSFTLLIPILNILFKTGANTEVYHFMEWGSGSLKEVAVNNFYYYVTQMIETHGPQMTLLFMGLFLAFMTMLKTSCYFGSSAIMVPLRTGVVRDIRVMVYSKVMHLPLGFFSEERKGDIIARMSGDVGEIENSITSSLDMLLKNPILILLYFPL